jgi:DNA invertase Pin-like site-specific DNA recombinase
MHASTDTPYTAIYGRSATTGEAMAAQLEACQAFARQHGSIVPEAYVCLDDGYAGTTLARPGLQRLRALIRTRAIEAVIVADLARLSRTLPDQLRLVGECAAAAVAVHIVLPPPAMMCDRLRCLRHDAELQAEERGAHG